MDGTFYRFMDKLEIQVALAPIRIRLCSGLQIVPAVFSAVKILKLDNTNDHQVEKKVKRGVSDMKIRGYTTCSFRTTFPKKSSAPFSFLASFIILKK